MMRCSGLPVADSGSPGLCIRKLSVFCVVLAFLCSLPGCARPINRAAERKIRDALPTYIGQARVWKAHVENAPERTVRGRLSHVTIEGEDVNARGIVQIARLRLDMRDAEVDTRRNRLKSVGETHFEATIHESALNAFLLKSDPPDDNVRLQTVRLARNKIIIQAAYKLLGREIGFGAEVEPRLATPKKLEFDPDRFSLLGIRIPLPASVLRWIAARMTEGFDFSTLPFPVNIRAVTVESGSISLTGTADVMQSLNEQITLHWK